MLARTRESQFITKMFPAELREISSRRSKLGITSPDDELTPSLNLGLAGLAFSGGGIRSPTFGLGVVQALAKRKVLRLVDYLSTVSGGGYIGSLARSDWDQRQLSPSVSSRISSLPPPTAISSGNCSGARWVGFGCYRSRAGSTSLEGAKSGCRAERRRGA